jgi:HAD superfamily hydrolase (TIGR01509 family)
VRPVRGVLFDFGHTLFETGSSVAFIERWAAAAGHPFVAGEAFRLWEAARVASRTAEEIAKGRDRSEVLHRQCWTDLWAPLDERCPGVADALYSYESSPVGWEPYSDTEAVLRAVKARGLGIAVVSDVAFDLRPFFPHYGLDGLVDSFVLSGERGSIKPDGLLFGIACEELGIHPHEALMVGDNPVNDGVAVTVGIRTLLLPIPPPNRPRGLNQVLSLLD